MVAEMNEWVSRALISAAASAVTTTAWVVSADRAGEEGQGPFRRKQKQRKKKKRGRTRERDSREQEREMSKQRSKRRDDPGGTTAAEDMRNYEEGMSGDEFVGKLKALGTGARSALTGLFNRGDKEEVLVEEGPPPDDKRKKRRGDDRREQQRRDDRREQQRRDEGGRRRQGKKRKRAPERKDGLSQLKEEAVYLATSAVKKKVVESTGLDKAVDAIKDGAESIKERGGELSQKVRDAIPEDISGKVSGAAGDVVETSKRIGSRIKEELDDTEELRDKVGHGLSDLGRWVQGPGAQDYRDKKDGPAPDQLPPARSDVVEAKMSDDDLPKDLPR